MHFSRPITCAVDRAMFDEYIATKAQDSGASYRLNQRVEALIQVKGFAKGVTVKYDDAAGRTWANLIVDAEGVSSRITRQAGLQAPRNIVRAIETEVENLRDTECDTVDVYLGNSYSPGFYAWLIPKKDGKAKLGLAARTGSPKDLLQRLILKHPVASKKLRSARTVKATFHSIPLGGPTEPSCSNGFVAVGDAASHVKPTTGGGVILGMTCARVAAEVASEAIQKSDFSKEFLATYQRRCRELLGFDMRIMRGMRNALDALSDRSVDDAISMCKKLGLDKTLQTVKDIDFQGQTLLRTLRSPRMFTAIVYFFFAYLTANL